MIRNSMWRKSSYSGAANNCVELGVTTDVTVIRDSKDTLGTPLTVSPAPWSIFLSGIKLGQFNV
jgi:hypothetical protein